MRKINAAEYGVTPGTDAVKPIAAMLAQLGADEEEKIVEFEPGDYYLNSRDCEERLLYITNTVGDGEFSKDETPHLNRVGIHFENIHNLTFNGNGARFVIDGKMTNIAVESCKNIKLCNFELHTVHPDMHELRVIGKSLFWVDFELDRDTQFELADGKLWFYGTDYRVRADKDALKAWWIALVRESTPDKTERVGHPLRGALKIKQTADNAVRVYYPSTARFQLGDRLYIFDQRRQFAGIFLNKSVNVTLEDIKQHFNYSLAVAAQSCDTLTFNRIELAPEKGGPRLIAAVADFLHLCMCRGQITVTNSRFEGAGDDCMNVHGIHFKVKSIDKNRAVVRFMHPQAHGFNPLNAGDSAAVIDPGSLLQKDEMKIVSSALRGEYEIELEFDREPMISRGDVIEDTSMCPDVLFENNTVTRIITRGILLTTRGKCVVKNNHFISNSMSGVLLSDDARTWYESGMCRDVTIDGNTFDYCGQTPILIKPENLVHRGAVHENIKIINNIFKKYNGCCISAKSSGDITVSGNDFSGGEIIRQKNCDDVRIENNEAHSRLRDKKENGKSDD